MDHPFVDQEEIRKVLWADDDDAVYCPHGFLARAIEADEEITEPAVVVRMAVHSSTRDALHPIMMIMDVDRLRGLIRVLQDAESEYTETTFKTITNTREET